VSTATLADIAGCGLVTLARHVNGVGCLTVLEAFDVVPFPIKRVFTIAGVPTGASRGGHANAITRELVVCLNGAVTVGLSDGQHEWRTRLEPTGSGVLIAPMVWVDLLDFASDTILLVLADTTWSDAGGAYFRDERAWRRALEVPSEL
jgi:hypothetical protein